MNCPSGKDLIPRIQKEMKEDDREALAAQYIDWYGAIPAGPRVTQCELLADTELSPRRSLMISGVGAADYELRKRNLALLTVHGPMRPQGRAGVGTDSHQRAVLRAPGGDSARAVGRGRVRREEHGHAVRRRCARRDARALCRRPGARHEGRTGRSSRWNCPLSWKT